MTLFTLGDFTSHSGKTLNWKIDCDALTNEDINTLASMIHQNLGTGFHDVIGIPEGGMRLAKALSQYIEPNGYWLLIVDDVLTTGQSMEGMRNKYLGTERHSIMGIVIFCRTERPWWVSPVFQLSPWMGE